MSCIARFSHQTYSVKPHHVNDLAK